MGSMIKRQSDEAFFKPPREHKKRGHGGFPIGPRTKARAAGNRELNKLPPEVKNRCEIKIPGICVGTIMLTWCHPTKSRFILTAKDWKTAARGCLPCHDRIEALKHPEMKKIVMEAIANRKPQS